DTARQIRTAFQILRSCFSEKEKLDFLQTEREREETESWKTIQNLHEELRMIPGVLPVWIPIIPLVLGLVMSIFFFVSTNHGNVALISLIAGSAGAMALFIIRNHRSAQLVMQKRFEKEKKQLEQKITVLQTDLEKVKLQRLRLEKAIAQKCRDALLPIPENLNQLEEQEQQWELDIDCFREWDQLHQEIDAATQRLTGVQKRCENAQKSMECAHWELVQYQKTWQDWLTNHSFPTTFRPDGFETILQVVENARAIEQSLNDMEAEMEQTESYIRMIRMKISEILKKCAVPQLPVEPGVRDLEILQFLVEEAIEKKRKCDDLTNQLAVLRIEKGSLENRTIAKNDEISALFDQAGAGNEEELRRIAMTFEEWCQCQKIIVENEHSLLVINGSLEKINDYEGEL
ncbi:MAG: hypothetical protein WCP87_06595, partial [Atribacterota bacterium]